MKASGRFTNTEPLPVPGVARERLYRPEPYFVLRTPAFPVHRLQWLLDSCWNEESLVQRLQHEWEDPWVSDAIYLASPSLHRRLNDWSWRITSQKDRKLLRAFYNYFSRMCTRPTPFGLFSASSTGEVRDHSNLELTGANEVLHRHTQIDVTALSAIACHLAADPALRRKLNLRLNDCGYANGSRWHYVEWSQAMGARTYALSSVELSEPLQQILTLVGGSGCSFVELVDRFCDMQPEFSRDAVEAFVSTLIDNDILLLSLEPRLTGECRLPAMLAQLQATDPELEAVGILERTQQSLCSLDGRGPGAPLSDYAQIEQEVRSLGAPVDRQRLFQVDLHRNNDQLCISSELATEIAQAAELRLRLLARRNGDLDEFCQKFQQRYEGRRVPLLEVLDEETGIGEGRSTDVTSELLDGVGLGGGPARPRSEIEAQLMAASLKTDGSYCREINLDPELIPDLDPARSDLLPDVMAAVATLVGDSVDAVEQGEGMIWLQGSMGSVAAHMTGRFCQGDPKLSAHVKAGLAREAQLDPDAVFAEVVHLPQEKYGNLVSRPLLRSYEIPLLGRSGAPIERQISLSELEIEVRGTEVMLWSNRLQKRVIPRMSAAHNYEGNTLGIYRFLCRLQQHNRVAGNTDVASLLIGLERVPRIRCGRVILFPARWHLGRDRAKPLIEANVDRRLGALENLRESLGLPRWVGIADGDNVLALDLHSPMAADILVAEFNKTERLHLVELYLGDDQLCVGRATNRFVHELVLPLIRNRPPPQTTSEKSLARQENSNRFLSPSGRDWTDEAESKRHRLPGSEWLSYRLFGGPAMLDRILAERIGAQADQWREQGWIQHWFFIRYHDPSPHLRIRFQGRPELLLSKVMPAMHQMVAGLVQERLIHNIEIATYHRELERYGGPEAIALCEQWFAQESQRICALLKHTRHGNPRWRWQLAMAGLVGDLTDFGLAPDDLLALFEAVAAGFRREFQMEKGRLASLGSKYRALTAEVCAACRGELPADLPDPEQIRAILDDGTQTRRQIGDQLRQLSTHNALHGTVESLLPSFVHMTCNRWFVDRPRANEMVLYDLIRRGLTALRAQHLGPWASKKETEQKLKAKAD